VNPFCELVGCRLPLQQAGMGRVATPALAAAVADAGGLGMMALSRHSPEAAARDIADVQSRTSLPVGVTLIVEFLREPLLRAVAERVRVVELFWGWPDPALVPPGNVVGWQVGTTDEARAAVDAGCRYVVAQGVEAGGHVRGTAPLAELLPRVRSAVDVPLVAAGGIGTRADVERALALGADAVRVGTRFVAAAESAAHPVYVDLLSSATAADTELTETFSAGWPDAPHRVLSSSVEAARESTADPVATVRGADGIPIPFVRFGTAPPTADMTGDIRAMALYAGTGVDAVHGRIAAAAIVAELTDGLESA
jgi:NAD(P)H-dependent flavin oxidoreductase YrpB (nitropropane dioxygenase family)